MIIFVVVIIFLVMIYLLICYNNFVKLNNQVKEAYSTMDIYLKKRWDLVPNIVEIVKKYDKYEKETLEEIVKLRNGSYENMNDSMKIDINDKIEQGLRKLIVISENYPELKANENFSDLSNQLSKIEDDIANARKYYNGTVRSYNNKVEMFPSNIFARFFGYRLKTMFEATVDEHQNVKFEL